MVNYVKKGVKNYRYALLVQEKVKRKCSRVFFVNKLFFSRFYRENSFLCELVNVDDDTRSNP
jgi:hypothetical protein